MRIRDIYLLGESAPFDIEPQTDVVANLTLEKAPRCYHTLLSGKVYSCGKPVKDATVMVLDDECNPISSTITDKEGSYKFRNTIKPGKYKIVATAIGYDTSELKTIIIEQRQGTKLSFSLKKSLIFSNGVVYGKVLETGTGKPVVGADIYLITSDGVGTVYKTISNHSGQYLVYNILPNQYKMVIRKQCYVKTEPLLVNVAKCARLCLHFDLVRESHDCINTISGRITCNKGPISKAVAFLYLLDEQENECLVQIQEMNESGFFMFSDVESGHYLVKGKQQSNTIYEEFFTVE